MTPSDAHPEGLRARKRRATRVALHRAALELADEHGYESVTIERICERAGFSTRTFFNYFRCKEEAFVLPPTPDDHAETLRPVAEGEGVANLLADVYRAFTADIARHAPQLAEARRYYRVLEENPTLKLRQLSVMAESEQELVRAVARRTGTDPERDLLPRVIAATVFGALRAAFEKWVADQEERSIELWLREALAALASGLGGVIPVVPPPHGDGTPPHTTTTTDTDTASQEHT
ncbi:TetR/AcrR family transcriptional regulator [Allostreptomyces psammosilenae]|uniref:AcrR family transcriptional regulator n=1 Tax=Allostreptomyces psammosilenae TaxID=1892865 RepID=A0A852ZLD8_9ACTN|nr:TetR family transcriptional regulator [Allostreptomyces psammosilenae]NYI03209.1 AcrR family transcriptional regulator [Allostreptomyces psammosilenae]